MKKCKNTLFILLLAILMTGCAKGARERQQPSADPPKGNITTTLHTDSIIQLKRTPHGSCEARIDYPTSGPKALVDALRTFIRSTLFEDGGENIPNDPQEMARQYCEQQTAAQARQIEQMGLRTVGANEAPEEGTYIRLVCTAERFVTYEVYRYSYISQGAHGEYADYGVTFRTSDGKRMSYILNKVDEQLFAFIREGLRRYFNVRNDEDLDELCTVDLSLLPMPTFPPYLVSDGVRFHYSIYDLCKFEDGDPALTIPYEIAKPYMTQEARDLVFGPNTHR